MSRRGDSPVLSTCTWQATPAQDEGRFAKGREMAEGAKRWLSRASDDARQQVGLAMTMMLLQEPDVTCMLMM
jgi:hypothetical protein